MRRLSTFLCSTFLHVQRVAFRWRVASDKSQVWQVASGKFRKRATGDGCRGLLLIEGTLKPVRGGATAYLKLIKALLSVSRLNNESGFHFVVVHVKNETYMIYVCRFK